MSRKEYLQELSSRLLQQYGSAAEKQQTKNRRTASTSGGTRRVAAVKKYSKRGNFMKKAEDKIDNRRFSEGRQLSFIGFLREDSNDVVDDINKHAISGIQKDDENIVQKKLKSKQKGKVIINPSEKEMADEDQKTK